MCRKRDAIFYSIKLVYNIKMNKISKKFIIFLISFLTITLVVFIFYKINLFDTIKIIEIETDREIGDMAEKATKNTVNIKNLETKNEQKENESNGLPKKTEPQEVLATNLLEQPEQVFMKLGVPFTSQAPLGNWKDQRQENGCEETAALMAIYWAKNKNIDINTIEEEIIDIADYQQEKYDNYIDTSSEDTVIRIFNEYFKYYNVEVKYNIEIDDIINELKNGNLVLVPTNGQKLNNPFYTAPGPTHHELVIIGYDQENNEFITNDPGTRHGEGYRYKTEILFNAIYDYKTGNNETLEEIVKAMIVVRK